MQDLDLNTASTRQRKRFLVNRIQRCVQEEMNEEQILNEFSHISSTVYTKDQIMKEIKKAQNGNRSQISFEQSTDAVHSQVHSNILPPKLQKPGSAKQQSVIGTPIVKPPKNPITNYLVAPEQ